MLRYVWARNMTHKSFLALALVGVFNSWQSHLSILSLVEPIGIHRSYRWQANQILILCMRMHEDSLRGTNTLTLIDNEIVFPSTIEIGQWERPDAKKKSNLLQEPTNSQNLHLFAQGLRYLPLNWSSAGSLGPGFYSGHAGGCCEWVQEDMPND